jgi:putative addiction module killer protein
MITIKQKQLNIYVTKAGKKPFVDWLESLDKTVRCRIKERLDRVTLGNLGDHKFIDNNIFELRMDFGSGYRIYCANEEEQIILLLSGGNKATQKKDIKKATAYLKDYLSR